MKFNLTPYSRSKSNTTNDWCFRYVPFGRVSKYMVVKRIMAMYPQLTIKKIHVIKSIKRTLVVLTTNKPALW